MNVLVKLEILRVLRNRRYLFFTVIYPVALFGVMVSAYGKSGKLDGVDVKPYFMISMATFGTVGAALNTALRISLERKSGWTRQLRLTALPGSAYVVAKVLASAATTLPAIVGVFLLGAAEGVHLSAAGWIGTALVLWLGGFVFAALGVALGYSAAPDSVQPIQMITYMMMAFLGGTWFQFSGAAQKVFAWTPMALYNRLGQAAMPHVGLGGGRVVALLAYFAAFAVLAAWFYQRDRKAV